MAAEPLASFNKTNKIRAVDLADDLREYLEQNFISDEDREKLDHITSTGEATKLKNPLTLDLNGIEYTFDAKKSLTVPINPASIGAARVSHSHDAIYSKRDHQHDYAGSDSPGGAANSAMRLEKPINVVIDGAVTGKTVTNLSNDIIIETKVNHEHNYAGAELPGGPALSANKLSTPVNIELTGDIVGEVEFDGSSSVKLRTFANHTHIEYSRIDHDHDKRYSKIDHTHYYAASDEPSGAAESAKKFKDPVTINFVGSSTGSFLLHGDEKTIEVELVTNHSHDANEITGLEEFIANEKLILNYGEEEIGEYDGSKETTVDIPSAHQHYDTTSDFPETGDDRVVYTDSNDNSYRWDSDDETYHNIGFGMHTIAVIDGNLA